MTALAAFSEFRLRRPRLGRQSTRDRLQTAKHGSPPVALRILAAASRYPALITTRISFCSKSLDSTRSIRVRLRQERAQARQFPSRRRISRENQHISSRGFLCRSEERRVGKECR